jgi:hypothetical protein
MVGNRQANRPQPQMQEINPLAEMMRLISGGMSAPSDPSAQAPRVRTFTFGNPAGGGIMGGATISIGGGPILGRDNQGFVRDPWGDAFGQSRGGRTADEAARERFPDGNQHPGQGYGFRPAPGDYVTIEDLLSHFLGGMTVAGVPGNGQMGDYVMSDGTFPPLFLFLRERALMMDLKRVLIGCSNNLCMRRGNIIGRLPRVI